MLIAQLSDTHIAASGLLTLGVAPMADNLAACVDYLNQLAPRPDIVLVTGDITDRGDAPATAVAGELLDRLHSPCFVLPGNHDDPATLWQRFGGTNCPSRTGAGIDYVIDGHPLRLIALDSTRPGAPGGELTGDQLDWLDRRLHQAPDHPTMIFMHHPPLNLGVPETDQDGFVGSAALGAIARAHPQIERIACGHVHLPISTRWNGTTVCTAPGTGMPLALDLTQARPSRFNLGPPTCLLHHWTGAALITHTVTIAPADGPYRFVDHPPGSPPDPG